MKFRIFLTVVCCHPLLNLAAQEAPFYSIGEPTGEEQLYLELMNRARANPAAESLRLAALPDPAVQESYRHFGVSVPLLLAEFAALPARPPLPMNGMLLNVARLHSRDQFDHGFQGHDNSAGDTAQQRVANSGYPGNLAGDNVYAFSFSTEFGHASFEVDWGPGPGGMQTDRKHRTFIHGGNIRDVGIGIVNGRKVINGQTFGPQVVTQTFGSPTEKLPRITGVAYYDLTGNSFYDPGEGIGGVTVESPGAAWRGVTAASGGYALPAPQETGPRPVRFTGLGFDTTVSAAMNGARNVKIDLALPYVPPAVSGPLSPVTGEGNRYTFPPVPGAAAHEWRWSLREAAPVDGAENLERVAAEVSAQLNPLATGIKAAGSASYHLAHLEPAPQIIRYRHAFLAGPAPVLRYHSRLAWAMPAQRARVEISLNGGLSWQAVDVQAGTGAAGQSGFVLREIPLTAAAGREFHLRFVYDVDPIAEHIPGSGAEKGWHFDEIGFSDVLDLQNSTIQATDSGHSFSFAPRVSGVPLLLSVRPVISGRPFPFGPPLEVTPAAEGEIIPPPPTPEPSFKRWAEDFERQAGLPPESLSGSGGDFNGDGVADLMAYALNLSPAAPAAQTLPQPAASGQEMHLDYPADLSKTDIILTSEASVDLVNWFAPGAAGAPAEYRERVLSSQDNVEIRRASVPAGNQPVYLRLKTVRR